MKGPTKKASKGTRREDPSISVDFSEIEKLLKDVKLDFDFSEIEKLLKDVLPLDTAPVNSPKPAAGRRKPSAKRKHAKGKESHNK
jgi:hypothetical protein